MTKPENKEKLLQHVIDISSKLVNGELENIDLSAIEKELNILADNFQRLIENFNVLGENIYHSSNEMPILSQHLEHISETTAEGVTKVMDNAEGIMNTSVEMCGKVDELTEKYKENEELGNDLVGIADYAMNIQNRAFSIMTSLEFEDINRQQIEKITTALTDFQNEFFRLLTMLKIKDYLDKKGHKSAIMHDLQQVVDLHNTESESKQDLIDELFKEFGL